MTPTNPWPDSPLPPGVLAPPPAGTWQLHRLEPRPGLGTTVAWLWSVEWDLTGRDDHRQSTLPHPSGHLVVEEGAAGVHGPSSTSFERVLSGAGRVVGVRFQPAGLRPYLDRPISSLVDERFEAARVLPTVADALDEVTGAIGRGVETNEAMRLLEAVVADAPRDVANDALVAELNDLVELIAADRSITEVSGLAEVAGRHRRWLQRQFAEYLGLGPKAVIRRYRLQEVAAAALAEKPIDWAAKAVELGYYDQAHLVSDFSATIGTPPATYAARTRPDAAPSADRPSPGPRIA